MFYTTKIYYNLTSTNYNKLIENIWSFYFGSKCTIINFFVKNFKKKGIGVERIKNTLLYLDISTEG